MNGKKSLKFGRLGAYFASFLVFMGILTGVGLTVPTSSAYAVGENEGILLGVGDNDEEAENIDESDDEKENTDKSGTDEKNEKSDSSDSKEGDSKGKGDNCQKSLGSLGWVVCPSTGKISEAVDWLYDKIEEFLVVSPISTEDGSPIYEIWKYCRGVTNIVFIIFLLVVIYSQLTGIGISNYGIKRALPKLIITAVLVNLSFLICSLAVDVSNIVGGSLRGVFTSVEEATLATSTLETRPVTLSGAFSALTTGGAIAIGAATIVLELGMIWMLIPVALGAIVAVVTGLVLIALRQAVVALLIMIAPLAIVANMLPNTEQWFKKWKGLLTRMLVFYPMFSLLFGASSLAGFAIIMSAKDGFGLLLGLAVQIFPLFFAWYLMKMSGTFLGAIGAKIQGIAAKPLVANRTWAQSHRAQTAARSLQYGKSPSARLRRFMDNRRELREQDTANLQALRKNRANMYAQHKISSGYDGRKSQGNTAYLKPNKYTRTAKDLSTSGLRSETMKMDTAHALGNYGDHYVAKDVRERIKAAEKAGDKALAERIKMNDRESRRNAAGAEAFLEYNRAVWTKEHDDEADRQFASSTFIGAAEAYKERPEIAHLSDAELTEAQKRIKERYGHFIISTAGGLGATGETRVLGKVLSQAAAVENAQRRDVNIVAMKWPPDKTNFRNMVVGYRVNDDGFAVDINGNQIENERGYLMKHDPSKLVLWDKVDENGAYFDWFDTNGNYVTRVYKKDKATIKELLSNFDAPINDPINNLYGMLAGIKEGDIGGGDDRYKNIGLEGFRTTIGRALMSAPFKEKNAAFSPLVKEMVAKGFIKNSAHEYLAYLDSITKATKPGAWNVQDRDAVKMFTMIMDPKNWAEIFPYELIKDFRNVNGEYLTGYQVDEDGKLLTKVGEDGKLKPIKVSDREPTYEELMAQIKHKFILPVKKKIPAMMTRMTPNMIENQKPEVAEAWVGLDNAINDCDEELKGFDIDPSNGREDMDDLIKRLRRVRKEEKKRTNHSARIREVYQMTLDAEEFVVAVEDYCVDAGDSRLLDILDDFRHYVAEQRNNLHGALDKDDLYNYLERLILPIS